MQDDNSHNDMFSRELVSKVSRNFINVPLHFNPYAAGG